LAALWVFLAAGCNVQLPGKPNPDDRPVLAKDELSFDVLYSRHCAGCHGADGTHGAAPPLNDPLFRAIVPQTELEAVLDMGRPWTSIWRQPKTPHESQPGTPMAAFARDGGGLLSRAQVQVLVQEMKGAPYRIVEVEQQGRRKVDVVADPNGIVPRWGKVGAAPQGTPPYVLPEKAGSAERGKAIFAAACASCHGDNGQGISGEKGQRNKINDVNFLSLISDQALRRIIITGRPDLKMPDYTDKSRWPNDQRPLNSSEIADLSALLSSWRAGVTTALK